MFATRPCALDMQHMPVLALKNLPSEDDKRGMRKLPAAASPVKSKSSRKTPRPLTLRQSAAQTVASAAASLPSPLIISSGSESSIPDGPTSTLARQDSNKSIGGERAAASDGSSPSAQGGSSVSVNTRPPTAYTKGLGGRRPSLVIDVNKPIEADMMLTRESQGSKLVSFVCGVFVCVSVSVFQHQQS